MLQKQLQFKISPILVVINEKGEYLGIITPGALAFKIMHLDEPMKLTAGNVCNRSARIIIQSEHNHIEAMVIFADNNKIWAVPVINDAKNLTNIIFRQQVFYLDFYTGANKSGSLPRMHYAQHIYEAAHLARDLGYESFSVIEFGVAGGNGLVACEFHIKEIARLFDIKIELYGFDTGEGLPKPCDHRDLPYVWDAGFYNMDIEKLKKRLQFARLVIGDLKDTASEFMRKSGFAPIGVMLIDVDYYSSTVPILNMLRDSPDKFLPRLEMYFDDVRGYKEHSGENLAIDEFNANSDDVKISVFVAQDGVTNVTQRRAHFFQHEKYNVNLHLSRPDGMKSPWQLPLF